MGGGHDHKPPYKIPDYRIYKVEDSPELLRVQEALAKQGLKDPWLRNEVWRYDTNQWGPREVGARMRMFFFRGFKYGLAAAVLTVAADKAIDEFWPSEHAHGHH